MRLDHLQNTLGVLLLLLTRGAYATTPAYTRELDCSLQAWVRAPDLVPGRIIQGDARLKLSAGCPAIEAASLGLRFKERSFAKALKKIWSHSTSCANRVRLSPVHYAHPDARPPRAPVFVDGRASNVEALREKTPAERDALAPVLKPVASSPPEGTERVHRYYRVPEGHRPLIYVGETWVKKVTHKVQLVVTPPCQDTMSMFSEMVAAIGHMVDEL